MQIFHDEARLPCGCRAWRLGSAADTDLCAEHYHQHLRREMDGWSAAERSCRCLRCRASRRRLAPFEYIEELAEQQKATNRGRAAAARIPDALAGERRCGCVMPVEGDLPRLVRCERHQHEWALRMAREQQQQVLKVLAAPDVEPPAPPEPSGPKLTWWRRLLGRLELFMRWMP